ncbi:PepSY-associated TM helix domain-containing protein [Zavarzinia compransoris]|uniref:PepSY domain-containing protein n=1 Tax=Zavarzinia compransoris TaxID=1264899 RepID=A0A317E0S4_9PROT|nr:PepSY domain-containing protein [Zavarzinia compransoris]PWR20677.1 hypothetical protein DKG75_11795 [Zavarzinia compransoris]TDP44501.1 putative iron-regulated membrane protein [Zavarzinia compransoris]
MTLSAADRAAGAMPRARLGTFYRAVWRWHFYAGLFALPFLIALALTGGLYLFKDEIELARHRDLLVVAPPAWALPADRLIAAAVEAVPGRAVKLVAPAASDRSIDIVVDDEAGVRRSVYVDPGTGKVLGSIPQDEKLAQVLRRIHSLAILGDGPNRVIEIVAGWAVILVVTGIYLWWPRGRRGGVVTIRETPGKRVFWRDLHAVTGIVAGGFVLFLAVTGLPWSGFLGDRLNAEINARGAGYPAYLWDAAPESSIPLGAVTEAGWTLEGSPVPSSAVSGHPALSVERALEAVRATGIAPGFTLALPQGAVGVYTASVFPDDITRQRAVHVDQYSGLVLADVGFADYGAGAKAIEWGINVHLGQEFGPLNQMLMLLACIAIVVMSLAAAVMWWKRRPARSFGVPPVPGNGVMAGASALILVLSLLFPLTAASLLAVAALEFIVRLLRRGTARA